MTDSNNHFDQIKCYDKEIPSHIAKYLNKIKTNKNVHVINDLMRDRSTIRGIDLGCGTGDYTHNLQIACGENTIINGLDNSSRQIEIARAKGYGNTFIHASMIDIDYPDNSYDFAYAINSIHHLPSKIAQEQMFSEVRRILRPGGVFIIHEINIKNPIIHFYMNYIFPHTRNIDDGSEIWLTDDMIRKSGMSVKKVEYFTFVPDFTPKRLLGTLAFFDKILSNSPFSVLGAHVMWVLVKPH
jgi:ubiquinone/menaquinone biosynthesis C-methylase UbiE